MAQRRMFSPKIVGSDAFLEMPTSTREFYFQLGMHADDDGFVQPRKIMRMVGAADDDLKMLIAKRFVLPFDNGVIVIKHWRVNNQIRADRYTPTQYIEQISTLRIKENGAYSESEGVPFLEAATQRQPDGNQLAPQFRLGKGSLDKREEDTPQSGDTPASESKDPKRSISYLSATPQDDLKVLSEKYQLSPAGIKSKAADLHLWCETNGKRKKNYKAFLETALRKDAQQLRERYPLQRSSAQPQREKPLTGAEIQRRDGRLQSIRDLLQSKGIVRAHATEKRQNQP